MAERYTAPRYINLVGNIIYEKYLSFNLTLYII